MRFSVLVDNNLNDKACSCEHGLSLWLEVCNTCVLLDTGQSNLFANNASLMNIDITKADYAIISHGHYDHTGGLSMLHELSPRTRIIMSPLATRAKYSVSSVMTKYNGVPDVQSLEVMNIGYVNGFTRLTDNVAVFSLPYDAPINRRLMIKENDDLVPDTFADELFTLITEDNKNVLFGGCTHHGLEQLLDYTYSVLGIKQIDAFIGGLHLKGKSDRDIECNIEIARKYNVRRWIVNHCTGNDAIALWCNAFDSNPRDGYTGSRFEV